MDNPGLKVGLAQNFNYDQRVTDLARQNDAKRQAQIYSEAKSKMLADDFDYNNAMNAWDNEAVKTFAQGKLKELGAFVRSNPDFETNLDKRIAYKNMVKELKDNKALNEGLQVDGNVKMMQAYMQDQKNAPLVQSEDFAPIMQAYQNYIKTGSTDGVTGNRKLFTFTPPEELVDTTPVYAKYAQMTALNGEQRIGLGPGAGSIKQFVSDEDKGLAAEGLINDKQFGRYVQKEYSDYLSKQPEGSKPLTLKQYAVNKMQPYFKQNEYKNYSYHVSDGGGKGKGSASGAFNPFNDLVVRAKNAPNNGAKWVAANPAGMNEILTGGKDALNTRGMYFETSDGNFVPVKGMVTKNFSTSGSKATNTPKYGVMGTVMVTMPIDQAIDFFDSSDILEDPWFGGPNVGEKYKDKMNIYKDANGEDVVDIELMKPLEESNTNTALGYNHGSGTKAEGVDSQYSNPQYLVSPDGKMYQDTATGKIYNTQTGQEIK